MGSKTTMETTERKSVIVRLFLVISHVVSRLSTRFGRPTLFLQLYWVQDRERSDYEDNHAEGEGQKAASVGSVEKESWVWKLIWPQGELLWCYDCTHLTNPAGGMKLHAVCSIRMS
jgi:hypothetical protein